MHSLKDSLVIICIAGAFMEIGVLFLMCYLWGKSDGIQEITEALRTFNRIRNSEIKTSKKVLEEIESDLFGSD